MVGEISTERQIAYYICKTNHFISVCLLFNCAHFYAKRDERNVSMRKHYNKTIVIKELKAIVQPSMVRLPLNDRTK